ncbi:MAG: dihydroorotate dehydrogenase-like protein [Bacteroidetes bacterium]|nr:dihydroorotate dehydrogenase-like protein [Bacteroidota bacterium]
MANLSVDYMGMNLKNPIIVGSSGLSKNAGGIQKIQAAGAGAVVLKTLFEVGIAAESDKLEEGFQQGDAHTEAHDLIHDMHYQYSLSAYADLIKQAKADTEIPIIASINCYKPEVWLEFTKMVDKAGADGIEINLSYFKNSVKASAQEVEDEQMEIVKNVISNTKLPVAVKIGPYYSSMANFVQRLSFNGAKAIVLFNRFYKVDLDLEKLDFSAGQRFSSSTEMSSALRWVGLMSGEVKAELIGSTGIKTGEDVVKMILAGAQAVQVCSAFYENGISYMSTLLKGMNDWMDENGFDSIDLLRARLSEKKLKGQKFWGRHQYIKSITGID